VNEIADQPQWWTPRTVDAMAAVDPAGVVSECVAGLASQEAWRAWMTSVALLRSAYSVPQQLVLAQQQRESGRPLLTVVMSDTAWKQVGCQPDNERQLWLPTKAGFSAVFDASDVQRAQQLVAPSVAVTQHAPSGALAALDTRGPDAMPLPPTRASAVVALRAMSQQVADKHMDAAVADYRDVVASTGAWLAGRRHGISDLNVLPPRHPAEHGCTDDQAVAIAQSAYAVARHLDHHLAERAVGVVDQQRKLRPPPPPVVRIGSVTRVGVGRQ
jgi:hypothetical protein